MHELATLAERRDALDDQELASLEEQSTLADEITALDAAAPGARDRAADAAAALAGARGRRSTPSWPASPPPRAALVARLDDAAIARYDRLRARLGGVAVARLEGSRCGGCHLDLSTGRARRGAGRPAPASSPTARSAGACWCPDRPPMFLWFIGTAIVTVRLRVPRSRRSTTGC